jgi:PIN domain nuclease of toxin-antitoxin system
MEDHMLRRRRLMPLAGGLVGLPLLLGLAGCGAASEDRTTSAAAPAAAEAGGAPAGADQAAPAERQNRAAAGAAKADGTTPAAPAGVQLLRTADVVVQVDNLATSAARVRAVAQSFGGTVSSEVTTFPDAPTPDDSDRTTVTSGETSSTAAVRSTRPGESVIVLRIPVASLDKAVDGVAGIGAVLSRTSTSQDVTADLVDVASRVKTQQAGVERVRQLLARASSLQDVVTLEAELTRRQSDLEALQARQASLADRAALSTLTVTLRTPAATAEVDRSNGFVAGLKRGWRAAMASTAVLLTLLGAMLPLIVLALVVGLPLAWWIRGRRARRRGYPAAPTDPAAWPGPVAPADPQKTPPPAP